MITILLFSLIAQAALREHDGDPGPKKGCRQAEMNSCIESHRALMNQELANIAAIDDKLRLIANDQSSLLHERTSLENEARAAVVSGQMAEREIRGDADISPSSSIFPAGPAPEEIFFLRGEPNSWEELHSAERKARLNTLAKKSQLRANEIEPLRRNLAMEIDALAEVGASLQRDRFQHGQQVNSHANMSNYDCRAQYCTHD